MKTPQVVIDTNVLIAAQRSQRGASSKLMSLVGTGRFDIHVSVPLVLEYEEVLLRQRLELRLTQADVANIVDALCALATPHEIYFLWRPYLHDRKDELILELAVAAHCDYIITRLLYFGEYRMSDHLAMAGCGLAHKAAKRSIACWPSWSGS
jgi:putative PIN family toxin of toxin-antitoxin system